MSGSSKPCIHAHSILQTTGQYFSLAQFVFHGHPLNPFDKHNYNCMSSYLNLQIYGSDTSVICSYVVPYILYKNSKI